MKCLSLKQPFAELIVLGKKTIELRNWRTKFRGEFLVHASLSVDEVASKINGFDSGELVRGAIIGKANLYEVKEYTNNSEFLADKKKHMASGQYMHGKYGFLLKDAVKFEKPIPFKGKLNFFEADVK
jgi:hypothetical protein